MIKFCKKCNEEFDNKIKTCPNCGKKLKMKYTKEELEKKKKEEEDIITTTTMFW